MPDPAVCLAGRNEEGVRVLLRQGTLFLPKFRAGLPNPVDITVQFVRSAVGRGEITSSDAEFRAAMAIG